MLACHPLRHLPAGSDPGAGARGDVRFAPRVRGDRGGRRAVAVRGLPAVGAELYIGAYLGTAAMAEHAIGSPLPRRIIASRAEESKLRGSTQARSWEAGVTQSAKAQEKELILPYGRGSDSQPLQAIWRHQERCNPAIALAPSEPVDYQALGNGENMHVLSSRPGTRHQSYDDVFA